MNSSLATILVPRILDKAKSFVMSFPIRGEFKAKAFLTLFLFLSTLFTSHPSYVNQKNKPISFSQEARVTWDSNLFGHAFKAVCC
jgi:hypothetical protein